MSSPSAKKAGSTNLFKMRPCYFCGTCVQVDDIFVTQMAGNAQHPQHHARLFFMTWECLIRSIGVTEGKRAMYSRGSHRSFARPTPVIGCVEDTCTRTGSPDNLCIFSSADPASGGRFPGCGLSNPCGAGTPSAQTDL
jgi:hypothetical protein